MGKTEVFGIQGMLPAHSLVHHWCTPEVGKVQGAGNGTLRYSITLNRNTEACSDTRVPSRKCCYYYTVYVFCHDRSWQGVVFKQLYVVNTLLLCRHYEVLYVCKCRGPQNESALETPNRSSSSLSDVLVTHCKKPLPSSTDALK